MSDLSATLAERGARYGDFADHARIAQSVQNVMRRTAGWDRLDATKKQALTVIADKVARILNGDPEYADNWHDGDFAEHRRVCASSRRPPRHPNPEGSSMSEDVETRALREALRLFVGAAYPVATEINARGYNWSQAYLDQALENARQVLAAVPPSPERTDAE